MRPEIERVLHVARGELGTREKPVNSNSVKYNRAYYGSDVRAAWCVVFQWWCFQKAGLPTSVFPKSNNVFAVRDWYKKRGRFDRTPRVGSLVIFSFSHIGIVEKVLPDGRIRTIEGNTDASGSRTGGKVMRKIRSRNIQGFCHPDWSAKSAASSPTKRPKPKRPAAKPPAPRPVPAVRPSYTAVVARDVRVPARTWRTVAFTEAIADGARAWKAPRDGKGGYCLARAPGLFVADVTLDVTGVEPGSVLLARLVEADPAQRFKRVHSHAPAEFRVTSADTSHRHAATTSRLKRGRHLRLQVFAREDVLLPLVKAEVLFLHAPCT